MKSGLIREARIGGNGLIREARIGGNGLIREARIGGNGLIRGMTTKLQFIHNWLFVLHQF